VNYIRSKSKFVNLEKNYIEYGYETPLLTKGNKKVSNINSELCREFIKKGFKPIKKNYDINVFPIFNIFGLILNFIIILNLHFRKPEKFN